MVRTESACKVLATSALAWKNSISPKELSAFKVNFTLEAAFFPDALTRPMAKDDSAWLDVETVKGLDVLKTTDVSPIDPPEALAEYPPNRIVLFEYSDLAAEFIVKAVFRTWK